MTPTDLTGDDFDDADLNETQEADEAEEIDGGVVAFGQDGGETFDANSGPRRDR
jgi:hypothetical protein